MNLGAQYDEIENQDNKIEINVINLQEEDNVWKDLEEEKEEDSDTEEKVENAILEARFVANKIQKLINDKYQIIDKKIGKRNIQYKDIAILLRSTTALAPIYEKEIAQCGIAVYSDSSDSYLQSIEIDTIMSVLKIINNPMQDIPFVTVLRSNIGNITDNELIQISLENKKGSFYERTINYHENGSNKELKNKINILMQKIQKWREAEKYKPLDELIWQIYDETGYMDYVSLLPNGELKVANLKLLFEKAKQYENASFKGLYNFVSFIDNVKMGSNDKSAAKIIGENENVVRIMSIHKSKGLEFPVVILAGTGKNFNFQDINRKILLDQDMGIGPDYIDATKHIEFKTLAKTAIIIKEKQDIVSEEMRVLYVALTRAKEKLIITGLQRDVNKSLETKEKLIKAYSGEENINPFLVQKYKSYLDWIELVYLKEKPSVQKKLIDFNIISKENLLKNVSEYEIENKGNKLKELAIKMKDNKKEEELSQLLNWKYNFEGIENIPTKSSVTKIKKMYENINTDIIKESQMEKSNISEIKPNFLRDEEGIKITSAQKGTLAHLCIQHMEEGKDYTESMIKDMISELVSKEIITEKESEVINIGQLLKYTQTQLWEDLKFAIEIHKEQPFYINMPISEIYGVDSDEYILVQGVIDLYYIDKNGKIILVDYKTDYVEEGMEDDLIKKYKTQLVIYKRALEDALNKKVGRAEIYAVKTGRVVIL